MIVPYTDYGDALRPSRDHRFGNLRGHGREGKAAHSNITRASQKFAPIVRIENVHDTAYYNSG
jgi:hypothetical protein